MGLALELDKIAFRFTAELAPHHMAVSAANCHAAQWHFRQFSLYSNYIISVCSGHRTDMEQKLAINQLLVNGGERRLTFILQSHAIHFRSDLESISSLQPA